MGTWLASKQLCSSSEDLQLYIIWIVMALELNSFADQMYFVGCSALCLKLAHSILHSQGNMWLIDQPKAGLLIQVPVINALHQDSPSCFNTARHVGILVSGIKEKDWKTIAKEI